MTWTVHLPAALAPATAAVPLSLEAALVVEGAPALESVRAGIVAVLVVVGSGFLVAGTIGLLRFDTVYNRMHATTKPTSIGVVAIFLASFVQFGPGGAGLPSLVGIVFLFLTIPTGAHMIARSAERMGVPFREGVTWPEPPRGEAGPGDPTRERPADDRDADQADADQADADEVDADNFDADEVDADEVDADTVDADEADADAAGRESDGADDGPDEPSA